jgi:hypothetical protein
VRLPSQISAWLPIWTRCASLHYHSSTCPDTGEVQPASAPVEPVERRAAHVQEVGRILPTVSAVQGLAYQEEKTCSTSRPCTPPLALK